MRLLLRTTHSVWPGDFSLLADASSFARVTSPLVGRECHRLKFDAMGVADLLKEDGSARIEDEGRRIGVSCGASQRSPYRFVIL